MNPNQYYTVLEVTSVVNTHIFGVTFWVTFVVVIDEVTDTYEGIVYFIDKGDAINLDIGDKILNSTVLHKNVNSLNRGNINFHG